jgi:hypothetical protein
MDDIPPRSYGPLIETTMRIVTWNVWVRSIKAQQHRKAAHG